MRLDKYLSERFFSSRTKAARAVSEGRVTVNGKIGKPSDEVKEGDDIRVAEDHPYVSLGGNKLERALTMFGENVAGAVCADFGASTGGFTDCLLRAGAKRVFAIDVGESQLAAGLAADARVTVLDNTNVRYLRPEDLPERPDVVTIDVSFISLTYVLPAAASLLADGGKIFALIKPQFECGGKGLDKHGVIKDAAWRAELVLRVIGAANAVGLQAYALVNAPLQPKKNVEYMVGFVKSAKKFLDGDQIKSLAANLI